MLDGIAEQQRDEHRGREQQPVGDEPVQRMAAQESQQEGDRRYPREERDDESDGEHGGLVEERLRLARVEERLYPRPEDDRCREEEREARRLLARQVAEESGGDRDPRAADAGQERDRLRRADEDRVGETERPDRPPLRRDALR